MKKKKKMMKRKKSKIGKYLLLTVLFTTVFFFDFISTLSVSSNGDIIWYQTISDGEAFSIKQSHSLSKTITTDNFLINSGNVFHTGIIFEDQGGGGLPDRLDENESFIINDEGKFVFIENKDMELPIRSLNNEEYEWQLIYKNNSFSTNAKYIETTLDKVSVFKLIYMKIRWK